MTASNVDRVLVSTNDFLYTEDFQHGQVVEGVRFLNPFVPES
jgi:predicted nucleic acid-binding protein